MLSIFFIFGSEKIRSDQHRRQSSFPVSQEEEGLVDKAGSKSKQRAAQGSIQLPMWMIF